MNFESIKTTTQIKTSVRTNLNYCRLKSKQM